MKKLPEYEPCPDGWFTCSVCLRHFEPDPDLICEGGVEVMDAASADCDAYITEDNLMELSRDELHGLGLTEADRKKLMNGESIDNIAVIICTECQDSMIGDPP